MTLVNLPYQWFPKGKLCSYDSMHCVYVHVLQSINYLKETIIFKGVKI